MNQQVKFINIYSDNVYKSFDNKTVGLLSKKFYLKNNPDGLCNELIDKTFDNLKRKYISIGDVTVITLFF